MVSTQLFQCVSFVEYPRTKLHFSVTLVIRKGEDFEAPHYVVLDYEPCDCCKDKFSQGVLFIEVTETQPNDNRPPISKGVYPTGRHVVVKREAVNVEGDKFLMIDKEFKTMFRIDWRK